MFTLRAIFTDRVLAGGRAGGRALVTVYGPHRVVGRRGYSDDNSDDSDYILYSFATLLRPVSSSWLGPRVFYSAVRRSRANMRLRARSGG